MSRRGILDRLRLALGYYPNSADEWAVRVQSPDIQRHEFVALDEWLKADPRNAKDYAKFNTVAHLGLKLRDHPELRERLVHYPLPAGFQAAPSGRFPGLTRWGLSFAAAACLLVAIGVAWMVLPGSSLFAPTYSAARGEQRQVTLADGSRMTVNTDTEVRVRFDSARRRLELLKGEAFFEVAKDAVRPFVVDAGRAQVTAVGTKFSVRRDADDTEVVVTEGKVQVVREPRTTEQLAAKPVDLVPGNRARIAATQPSVQVAMVDAARATAWTVGYADFDEATLAEVLRDVNRYTTRQFVIADPALAELRLSGRFRVGDIESVRAALRDRFDLVANDDAERIILSRRR